QRRSQLVSANITMDDAIPRSVVAKDELFGDRERLAGSNCYEGLADRIEHVGKLAAASDVAIGIDEVITEHAIRSPGEHLISDIESFCAARHLVGCKRRRYRDRFVGQVDALPSREQINRPADLRHEAVVKGELKRGNLIAGRSRNQ